MSGPQGSVPQFIGDNEAAQSIYVSGNSFRITGNTFTKGDRTATIMIVGNETGGRVIIDVTVKKVEVQQTLETIG
jgi:hypothetical protein